MTLRKFEKEAPIWVYSGRLIQIEAKTITKGQILIGAEKRL